MLCILEIINGRLKKFDRCRGQISNGSSCMGTSKDDKGSFIIIRKWRDYYNNAHPETGVDKVMTSYDYEKHYDNGEILKVEYNQVPKKLR